MATSSDTRPTLWVFRACMEEHDGASCPICGGHGYRLLDDLYAHELTAEEIAENMPHATAEERAALEEELRLRAEEAADSAPTLRWEHAAAMPPEVAGAG